MANLSKPYENFERPGLVVAYKTAADTKVFKGAAVGVDSGGNIVPLSPSTANLKFVGIAGESCDNSGGAAAACAGAPPAVAVAGEGEEATQGQEPLGREPEDAVEPAGEVQVGALRQRLVEVEFHDQEVGIVGVSARRHRATPSPMGSP